MPGWLRFPTQGHAFPLLALFHTMIDMMTVILRIDVSRITGLCGLYKWVLTL
jgi:hypothetical protein